MNTNSTKELTKITLYLNPEDSDYVRSAYHMFRNDRMALGLGTVSLSRFCKSLMIEALGTDKEAVKEEREPEKH